jgi:hypothetical protein
MWRRVRRSGALGGRTKHRIGESQLRSGQAAFGMLYFLIG